MLRLSKNQSSEIDFLSRWVGDWYDKPYTPTESEIEEFIAVSVMGHNKEAKSIMVQAPICRQVDPDTRDGSSAGSGQGSKNRLLQSKRLFDTTVKMWAEDWNKIAFRFELLEDFDHHPYAEKVVNSIQKRWRRESA